MKLVRVILKNAFKKIMHLTLSSMDGFWNDIAKCSEGEGDQIFRFFFIGKSATKKFARSRIFRYGLFNVILSKRQRKREGGAYSAPPPHALRG